jgi:hypothetical protein
MYALLGRFTGLDKVQLNPIPVRPFIEYLAGEIRSMGGHDFLGSPRTSRNHSSRRTTRGPGSEGSTAIAGFSRLKVVDDIQGSELAPSASVSRINPSTSTGLCAAAHPVERAPLRAACAGAG